MKNLLWFVIITFVFLGCNQDTTDGNERETPTTNENPVNENSTVEVTPEWGNTHCPIMENPITEDGGSTVYQGKTVRFCCPKCIKKFNADPEKYVAILAQYTPEKK